MPRHGNLSFCCGAGGARMGLEEKRGTSCATSTASTLSGAEPAAWLLAAVRRGTPA